MSYKMVRLEDNSGARINPAKDETLQQIDEKLFSIIHKLRSSATLTYDEVAIGTEHGGSYTDAEKMFDKNWFTYGTIDLPESGEFIVVLNEARKLSGIVFVSDQVSDWSNISYQVNYEDGTSDSGNVQGITDVGGYIPVDPTKPVTSFALKNYTSTEYNFTVYELWITTAYDVSALTTLLKVGDQTLTPRDWSSDFARLQNLDTQLSVLYSKLITILDRLDDIDVAQADFLQLKFFGNYTSGTYTATYTPANGEIVMLEIAVLNSYTGRAELTLDWDGDTLADLSVDANYYEMNAQQFIKYKIIGDGTKQLTLTLNAYSDGTYFGAARMWKVKR